MLLLTYDFLNLLQQIIQDFQHQDLVSLLTIPKEIFAFLYILNVSERFNNTEIVSNKKRNRTQRHQNGLELNLDVKDKFHGVNPHPVFQVAKLEQ